MLTAITVMTKLVAVLAAMLSWHTVRPADAPAPAAETVVQAEPVVNTSDELIADAAPAQPASESIADEYTDADELLGALETAGNDVRRLSAVVRYVKTFAIQGDTQQRDGTLAFVSTPAGAEARSNSTG